MLFCTWYAILFSLRLVRYLTGRGVTLCTDSFFMLTSNKTAITDPVKSHLFRKQLWNICFFESSAYVNLLRRWKHPYFKRIELGFLFHRHQTMARCKVLVPEAYRTDGILIGWYMESRLWYRFSFYSMLRFFENVLQTSRQYTSFFDNTCLSIIFWRRFDPIQYSFEEGDAWHNCTTVIVGHRESDKPIR